MPGFDSEVLAANLRANRASRRVTQRDVADAIGSSQGAVQKWESGESIPMVDSMFALADFYDTTIDELCGHSTAA